MPSNDNLTIKFGQKSGSGNAIPINNATKTPGSIYAAKNSIGEVEMYLDTPEGSNTERKRLDPRIFVGALPAGKTESQIWNNYDVWIDTSGDPTGNATPGANLAQSTSGLMSANAIFGLSQILTELKDLKIQIVTQSYWNDSTKTNGTDYDSPRNKNDTANLTGWLTIVVPDTAGQNYNPTEGANQNLHPKDCLLEWDFSSINVTPQSGGSGS